MSIRTWVFLALLAMTLLGMGGISAAHAEDIDCTNGRYSNDDSDTADCIEERKEEERQEEERQRKIEEEEREKEQLELLEAMFRAPFNEFPTYNEPPTYGFPSVLDPLPVPDDGGSTAIVGRAGSGNQTAVATWDDASGKHSEEGQLGGPECIGRCGPGCDSDPSDDIYTRDCLNHDICIERNGDKHLTPYCMDEFPSTLNDYPLDD
jgi:hypothetical protein